MTPTEYIQSAQRTTAPATPELMERLLNPQTLSLLAYIGGKFIAQAETLDVIKKHVFYGRHLNSEVSLPPPSDHDEICQKLSNEKSVKLIHGILGKCTEAGELMEALLTHLFNGEELDVVNIMEELGDDQWYNAEVLTSIEQPMEEIWIRNIDKLKARYGAKFTNEAALNRDLVNERSVLEGNSGGGTPDGKEIEFECRP